MKCNGRLERVYITREYNPNCAYADFNDKQVLVNYGNPYIQQDVIVRFGYKHNNINFVTSHIPPEFNSLGPLNYVLVALWEDGMLKSKEYPTLNEINRYYDPLDMPQAIYIEDPSSKRQGRVAVTPGRVWPIHAGFSRIIRKTLPDPNRASRLVITESEIDLEKMIVTIGANGLSAILMEPLP